MAKFANTTSFRPWRQKRRALPTHLRRKIRNTDAYELEALAPSDLVSILKDAIEQVVDLNLFNQELAAE